MESELKTVSQNLYIKFLNFDKKIGLCNFFIKPGMAT